MRVATLPPLIAGQAAEADSSGPVSRDRVTEQYGRHLLDLPTENPF